ncbi:secreted protein [Streptomyces lincolnensis]|uniref:Secreted protein n=1 Tax=Streptomyces lincolnensis TaxID=1915 RepID=A0A1B1MM41_STRLN|nr:hypothetical protein [Streptomyces lincolnensis]ANS69669.1 secreted protein [Streptomyces lincolnensis]AXG58588.1 secreted protein [Streptomyces lincolnensis]
MSRTITRRGVLAAGAATAVAAWITHAGPAAAAPGAVSNGKSAEWTRDRSVNGWPITPDAVSTHLVEGSRASVDLRDGPVATVLLHIARRWHYEIAPLDTGQGGGISGHTTSRTVAAEFESTYLSGTALCLHPTAYPLGGSEGLWPHHERIVRDILLDCEGTVVWGGDLDPVKRSHFHIAPGPDSDTLAGVAERLSPLPGVGRTRGAGAVRDPAHPSRRVKARRLERAQNS